MTKFLLFEEFPKSAAASETRVRKCVAVPDRSTIKTQACAPSHTARASAHALRNASPRSLKSSTTLTTQPRLTTGERTSGPVDRIPTVRVASQCPKELEFRPRLSRNSGPPHPKIPNRSSGAGVLNVQGARPMYAQIHVLEDGLASTHRCSRFCNL